MQKKNYKLMFLVVFVLLLIAAVSLQASADTPTPDYYITWDNTNSVYLAGTSIGGSEIKGSGDSCALTAALKACGDNWSLSGSAGSPVIQLGSESTPLSVQRVESDLITGTYFGSVIIGDSDSSSQSLTVPSGVTATLLGFNITNETASDTTRACYGITVNSGGSLNIEDGTSIHNTTVSDLSNLNLEYIACGIFNNGGTVTVDGGSIKSEFGINSKYGTVNITKTDTSTPVISGGRIGVRSMNDTGLNISGGNISTTSTSGVAGVYFEGPNTFNLSGGSVSSSAASGYGVELVGTSTTGTMTISGDASVSMTGIGATAVYSGLNGKMNIAGSASDNVTITSTGSGGTGIYNNSTNIQTIGVGTHITAPKGVRNDYGTMNIEGGDITSSADDGYGVFNYAGILNISAGTITASGVGGRAVDNWKDAVISGGTLKQTENTSNSYANYCVFNNGTLDLKGNCKISCVGTGASAVFVNWNAKSLTVSENAEINGTSYGINNSDKCPLIINGGSITANSEVNGCKAINSSGDVTMTAGTISAIGYNPTGILHTSDGIVSIQGGSITTTSSGVRADAILNAAGTLNVSGGSITAAATGANACAVGISNFGNVNISGGITSALSTSSDDITFGIQNSGSGNITLTGGTITSGSTYSNSAAVCNQDGYNCFTDISGSAIMKSATKYTVLSKQTTTKDMEITKFYGKSLYNSNVADVTVEGELTGGYYTIDAANYTSTEINADNLSSGYQFIAWTSDSDRKSNISTSNGAIVTGLSGSTVYLKALMLPQYIPSGGSFTDSDCSNGIIEGTVKWTNPTDTSNIDGYKIYWGSDASTILSTDSAVQYTVDEASTSAAVTAGTVLPAGAKYFLIYSYNEAGNSSSCLSVPITDYSYVTLTSDSLGTAGNNKITGLTSGSIYKVTVYDTSGGTVTKYTKADGTLTDSSFEAGKLSGTEITGLTIGVTYKVEAFNSVILDETSTAGIAGDSKITGLISGAIYKVTIFDAYYNETIMYTKEDGTLTNSILAAAKLTGTEIAGLSNGIIYKVDELTGVVLTSDSLGVADDSKITGLTSGAIYKVTLYDAGYSTLGTKYVKADGTLTSSFSERGKLSLTEITGLTNGMTYDIQVLDQVLIGYIDNDEASAADSAITGLTAGVIYKVTVYDENQDKLGTKYVTSDGYLTDSVSNAGELDGTEIKGLINGYTYDVEVYSTVTLAPGSLGVAGDREITGLVSGLKYTLTVTFEGENITAYVDSEGGPTMEGEDWAPLSGKKITNLENEMICYVEADRVALTTDSLGTATDSAITDVTSGAIYKVSNYHNDENSIPTTSYVKADGTDITGLKNGWIYKVEVDNTAPVMSSLYPGNGVYDISADTDLVLTFSEDVTAVSGKKINVMKDAGDALARAIGVDSSQVDVANNVVTVNLSDGLEYSTKYYVLIDEGAFTDASGNEYKGIIDKTVWSFTTAAEADKIAPSMSSLSPENGVYSINADTELKITFSENVTAASGKNIKIMNGADDSEAQTISADCSQVTIVGNVATIKPSSCLANNTTYYVLIDEGAFIDSSGNEYEGINDKTAWYFTTGDGSSSGSGSGSGSSGKEKEPSGNVPVIVDGKTISAGKQITGIADDGRKTTTVTVLESLVSEQLASAGNNATVTVPITGDQHIKTGVLTGQMVKDMENQDAVLEIKTGSVSYVIPAQQINISEVSDALGANIGLSDIVVSVSISDSSEDKVEAAYGAVADNGSSIVVPPVDFTITAEYNGKTVAVDLFNNYVTRLIKIPSGVDPTKITTGIVLNADGTIRHIPTQITVIDGIYYAKINSLTNSTYSVIWNPLTFSDVENHWAKDIINDVGARLIVNGIDGNRYEPNRSITRAEFAAIVVRALGLAPGTGENKFSDVASGKWYCGYIESASAYGIITGYGNGLFGPQDTITREQAMAMIARAMKITGLETNLTGDEANTMLAGYSDGSAVSSYAETSIAACLKAGVVSGVGNQKIAPKKDITRAEVAAIVQRLLKKSDLI